MDPFLEEFFDGSGPVELMEGGILMCHVAPNACYVEPSADVGELVFGAIACVLPQQCNRGVEVNESSRSRPSFEGVPKDQEAGIGRTGVVHVDGLLQVIPILFLKVVSRRG